MVFTLIVTVLEKMFSFYVAAPPAVHTFFDCVGLFAAGWIARAVHGAIF